MKKKLFLIILTIVVCVLIVKSLPPTEEEHIKKDIESLKDAIEMEDKIKTFSYIDESYQDMDNLTYEELKSNIDEFFADFDSIKVLTSGIKIKIDSIDAQKTIFASCSLGLKVFARYGEDRIILYGGIIKPAAVRACLKKSETQYKIYFAEY